MTEVHSTLELRFGNPSNDKKQEEIEKDSIEFGYSIQKMLLYDFEYRFINQWFKEGRENILELMSVYIFNQKVRCSKVTYGTYKNNGISYPKIVIHDDYWDRIDSDGRVWVNDEMIEDLGKEFDLTFQFEYVDFLRIKK
jgi:hypothetical protein